MRIAADRPELRGRVRGPHARQPEGRKSGAKELGISYGRQNDWRLHHRKPRIWWRAWRGEQGYSQSAALALANPRPPGSKTDTQSSSVLGTRSREIGVRAQLSLREAVSDSVSLEARGGISESQLKSIRGDASAESSPRIHLNFNSAHTLETHLFVAGIRPSLTRVKLTGAGVVACRSGARSLQGQSKYRGRGRSGKKGESAVRLVLVIYPTPLLRAT